MPLTHLARSIIVQTYLKLIRSRTANIIGYPKDRVARNFLACKTRLCVRVLLSTAPALR